MTRSSVMVGLVLGLVTGCSNTPPTAPVLSISPAEPTTLEELVASITTESTDDDRGDEVTYTWSWRANGVLQSDLTGPSVPAEATARGDVWTVEVVATDGSDDAVGEASVTIVNTAPELTGVEMLSETPGALEDIVVIPAVTNVDDDLLTYTYSWTLDGEAIAVTGDRVSASFTEPDQVWEVSVSVSDGEFESGPLTASATVGNAAPIVRLLSIEPAEPTRLSTLQAMVSASDYDGHDVVLTYSWTVDEVEVGTGSSLSASTLEVGDEVSFRVTATDGYTERSAETSSPIVIGNLAPVVDSVELMPTTPYANDDIEAVVSASDAESDPFSLTYAWLINGTEVSRGSNPTLSAGSTVKGDSVAVEVWGTDPYDDGVSVVASSVVVQNSVPTAPVVVFDPETPRDKTNLICALETPSTDADGDDLVYTVRWERNGSPFTGTIATTNLPGDTIRSNSVVVEHTWECFVTVSDGEAQSDEASSGLVEVRPLDDGSEPDAAGKTCATINANYPSLADGVFWIDPNEGAKDDAFQVYCDMKADGGGWTLLSWTGNTQTPPYGVPYPGLATCTDLGCLRGSVGSKEQVTALTAQASAYVKAQTPTPMTSFGALDTYEYVGKYDYGDLSSITPQWGQGNCDATTGVQGTFVNLKGADVSDGKLVYLAQGFRYAGYDTSSDANSYIWNVGVPDQMCSGSGQVPGTWMGTWASYQYGPGVSSSPGAHSVWVR